MRTSVTTSANCDETIALAENEQFPAANQTQVKRFDRPTFALVVLYLLMVAPTLGSRSGFHHAWRQGQTADTTRIFFRNGIDLFHPSLSVFGPNAIVPFELPWYQAIATLWMRIGVPEIVAMRGTSAVFTVLTALGLSRIAHRLAGQSAARWALGLYLINPFTLAWGRAILIESFTTAAVMAWILSAIRLDSSTATKVTGHLKIRDGSGFWCAVTVVSGTIAATSKFTTALPWALVVAVILGRSKRLRDLVLIVPTVVIPLSLGMGWTMWADHLKSMNRFTQMQSSAGFRSSAFMTIADRFRLSVWTQIGFRTFFFLGGVGLICLIVGVVTLVRSRQVAIVAALITVPFSACVIFLGLYNTHDYYQSAITPALAIVCGVGTARLYGACRSKKLFVLPVTFIHVFGFVAAGSVSLFTSQIPGQSAPELADTTRGNEQVIGAGMGWDPQPFYEADRHGLMLTGDPDLDSVVQRLDSDLGNPRVLWVSRLGSPVLVREFLDHFDRIAAVGRSTYRFGSEKDLTAGPSAPLTVWRAASSASVSRDVQVLTCDGVSHKLSRPTHRLSVVVDEDAKSPWIETNLLSAPIPIRSGSIESVELVFAVTCRPDKTKHSATGPAISILVSAF
jgi:Alg9-like mannosyltransferase family